mgnify:CR=1 FL=1
MVLKMSIQLAINYNIVLIAEVTEFYNTEQ